MVLHFANSTVHNDRAYEFVNSHHDEYDGFGCAVTHVPEHNSKLECDKYRDIGFVSAWSHAVPTGKGWLHGGVVALASMCKTVETAF